MIGSFASETRVAPHDQAAEISVLGSVLLEPSVLKIAALADLKAHEFYFEAHRHIWKAFGSLVSQEAPIDLTTLSGELSRTGHLEAAGGVLYLIGLGDQVPTSAHADHYARIVREHAHLRALISHAGQVTRAAYDRQMALEDLQQLAQTPPPLALLEDNGLISIADALGEVLEQAEAGTGPRGFDSGIKDLDRAINGFEPGRLYVLAARPAMGKSALAFQISTHMGLQGHRALQFSLEMPASEISARIGASLASVSLDRLTKARRGEQRLSDRDLQRLKEAHERLKSARVEVLPKFGLKLSELLDEVRRAHAKDPLSIFVLDYLQLVQISGRGGDNANQRVTEVTNALKRLALELDIPVLALSQLSRAVESRADRRPLLSDLRESGSVEQDADVVLFIYRDDYYHKASDQQGIAELIIGKNRNGPTDTVKVQFQSQFVRFSDLAYD